MRQSLPADLPRLAFGTLIAADLLGATAFIANQWFGLGFAEAWGLAGLLLLPALMLVVPMIDALPWSDRSSPDVRISGVNIPGTGQ